MPSAHAGFRRTTFLPAISPTRSACEGVQGSFTRLLLRLTGLLCLGLLFCGCAAQPYVNSHIESVNTEYRQLEDYVYALEEENSRLHQEIESLKTGGKTERTPGSSPARGGLFRRSPANSSPRGGASPADSSPSFDAPLIEMPGSTPSTSPGRSTTQRPDLDASERAAPSETPPSIDPPKIELPATKPIELLPVPAPSAAPSTDQDVRAPTVPDPISPRPVNKKVTHLFVNPTQTGAANFDGRPGDDGLRLVLEPRNSDNEYVAEAGALSIVLLDPDKQGEGARIARWDFDQSNSRQLLAASDGRGIKLEVPWPAAPPVANKLKLFVRYETDDGRKLTADRDIYLNAQAQAVSGWTPRSVER